MSRKKAPSKHQARYEEEYDYNDRGDGGYVYQYEQQAGGSGYNAVRARSPPEQESNYHAHRKREKEVSGITSCSQRASSPRQLLNSTPETTIGVNVVVRGELEFQKLLRIDGSFTGQLKSKGDLIVGAQGKYTGDINGMRSVLVDGGIVGNVTVDSLALRGHARVEGNVTCKSLYMDPTVTMVGTLNVHPDAPGSLHSDGKVESEVVEEGSKKKTKKKVVDGEKIIAEEMAVAKKKKKKKAAAASAGDDDSVASTASPMRSAAKEEVEETGDPASEDKANVPPPVTEEEEQLAEEKTA